MITDHVHHWYLLLEEYGTKITYIKGVDNTVADVLNSLKYDPSKHVKNLLMHEQFRHMATLLSHYNYKQPGGKVFYTGHTHTGSL